MEKQKENAKEEIGYVEALKLLTPREIEMVELVVQGYTSKEISDILSISINTVNTHRKNIKDKLNKQGPGSIVKWYWVNIMKVAPSKLFSYTHY